MSSKKYILLINKEAKEDSLKLIEYFKSNGWGWWHKLYNSWLIIDKTGNSTLQDIEKKINELYPGINNLIIEVRDSTWIGYGPNTKENNFFNWLQDTWSSKK